MNPAIFREYDIRGLAEKDFDADFAHLLGRVHGTALYQKGGRRVASDLDRIRAGRGQRVEAERRQPDGVEREHEREAAGPHEPGQPHQGEPGRHREPSAGRDRHHVGASICSRIAASAASAVTPSSSSSGATLTRWRSTAAAMPFTSSGTT